MVFFINTKAIVSHGKTVSIFFAGLAIISIGIVFFKGLDFGVEFSGGTVIDFHAKSGHAQSINIENLSKSLNTSKFSLQSLPNDRFLFKMGNSGVNVTSQEERLNIVKNAIWSAFKDVKFNQIESVGPQIGSSLARQSIFAVLFAFITMILYLLIRFNFAFAVSGVLVLMCNFLITLGFTSFFRLEVDLTAIASFLTLIGYGINDTVVLYDRIRTNLSIKIDLKVPEVVIISLREIFSRGIITSFVTTLSLVGMIIFSSGPIKTFAIITVFGIVVSVFGSLFVASSLPIYFGLDRPKIKMQKKKDPMFYAS